MLFFIQKINRELEDLRKWNFIDQSENSVKLHGGKMYKTCLGFIKLIVLLLFQDITNVSNFTIKNKLFF